MNMKDSHFTPMFIIHYLTIGQRYQLAVSTEFVN